MYRMARSTNRWSSQLMAHSIQCALMIRLHHCIAAALMAPWSLSTPSTVLPLWWPPTTLYPRQHHHRDHHLQTDHHHHRHHHHLRTFFSQKRWQLLHHVLKELQNFSGHRAIEGQRKVMCTGKGPNWELDTIERMLFESMQSIRVKLRQNAQQWQQQQQHRAVLLLQKARVAAPSPLLLTGWLQQQMIRMMGLSLSGICRFQNRATRLQSPSPLSRLGSFV